MSKIDFPSGSLSKIISVTPISEKNGSLLHVGEVVQGRVIEQTDNHHAVLQIKGETFWAESRLPLFKNMDGYFRVDNTDPRLVLRLLPEGERINQPIAPWLKQFFFGGLSLEDFSEKLLSLYQTKTDAIPSQARDTFDRLFSLLSGFSIEPPFSLSPDRLQEIVIRSGFFLEHQLKHLVETHAKDKCRQTVMGDLKGLLIKLRPQLSYFPSPGGGPESHLPALKEIESGLEKILEKIEAFQLLNLDPSRPQGKIFILLPLWFENNLRFVEMTLSLPRSDSSRSEQEGITIVFLLDMPGWGKMSVEVKMKGKSVCAQFKVSNPAVSAFLSQAFPEFQAQLNQKGFQSQLGISVETTEKISQTFLNEIENESESLLNILI